MDPEGTSYAKSTEVFAKVTPPTSVDWRNKTGILTPIKDQGACGSCWTFSAATVLESTYAISKGKAAVSLSEQELVDCAGGKYGNLGCNGGFYTNAWDYVYDKGGLSLDSNYKYTSGNGKAGTCKSSVGTRYAKPTSKTYVNIAKNDQTGMMNAVARAPVSICVDASQTAFSYYKSGLFDTTKCSSTNTDHAITLVGY